MNTFASGAAYVDRSGAVVAADVGFATHLGLGPGTLGTAVHARAESSPELRALLAGEGGPTARVTGPFGEVELERIDAQGGALIVARAAHAGEWLEHAMRSQGLTRLAAGLAHDIKNPLNAMALQLALLTDKLASSEDAGASSAGHLGALRDQIGRVNEVVRRFLDVTDPAAPLGYTDLGALLGDTASLFAHDARRHRVEVTVDAPRSTVRTRSEPARVGRLLLGIFSRALAETPEGGRLTARAEAEGDDAWVRIQHALGAPDPESGYYTDVVAAGAAALGGSVAVVREGTTERVTLRLPRSERS